jgi:hypothetical protein
MVKRVIDFSNVKDQGAFNPRRMPEGVYAARVTAFAESVAKSSGNDMWTYTVQLTDFPSAVYPYRCTLNAEALWKIRNIFIACGIDVPKKRMNVDPERVVGKDIAVELEDDEYEGRPKSNVFQVYSLKDMAKLMNKGKVTDADLEDDEEDDDEEEPPPARKRKPAAAKKRPEPEEEDDDEEEEEAPPPKKRVAKKKPAPAPVEEDDEDEEEDEDEEPPPPPRRKKKRAAPPPDDDDDEFDLDEV